MIRFGPLSLVAMLLLPTALAEEKGTLIFEDDFERSESQEEKDEPGNGWNTNSEKRANGHKQVDLKDGTMRIFIHEEADHGVSVTHEAEFTDGAVGMRFMLEHEKDVLGLNFADLKFKEVHAGHLFVARIGTKSITLQDLKTGVMANEIRERRTAKASTPEDRKLIAGKTKQFPHELDTGTWYELLAEVDGDVLTISIDGKEVASFQSEGIAHETKRTLRLAIARNAVVDDVRIWRR